MGTKTITIMEDAYEMLVKQKNKDESFSEVIRRICEKKALEKYFGALKDMPLKDFRKFEESINKMRDVEK